MKKNLGKNDRILRLILGIVFIYLGYANVNVQILKTIFLVLGIISIIEWVIGYCPLYEILGIKSSKK